MTAEEVVSAAKKKGFKISKAYVHNIRSAALKTYRELKGKEKKLTKKERAKAERLLMSLIVSLGTPRVKNLLAQAEAAQLRAQKEE